MTHRARLLARFALRRLPKSHFAYRCARAYMNWYRGENNHITSSNGEEWILRLLLPYCRVVFDVGANVGDWSALALSINPEVRIHAFEPASATFARLEARRLPGVTLNRCALGDKPGDVKLHLYGAVSEISSIVCDQTNTYGVLSGAERVPLITFDQYVGERGVEHVDFMKIDVEGSERLVFAGMEESLRNGRVDVIQFEYGRFSIYGRVFLLDLFRLLRSHGFSLYKLVQNSLHHYEEYRDGLESFEYQNWIAARDGSKLSDVVRSKSIPGWPL